MWSARISLALVALVAVAAASAFGASTSRPAAGQEEEDPVPIIFVHGFVGSAGQYQSQAMRFASNGYPPDHIRAFEYNSLDSAAEIVRPALDEFIDGVRDELEAEQVYVAGHSLGTSVMQGYLKSSPERAARVAKYINIDGAPAAAPPGGVPTLAIWGMGNSALEVTGGENVYFPDQTHVEVATSPESFAAQYEFLLGEAPATTDVEPEDEIEIAGRAVRFPENEGIDGATLEVWEVDGSSGARTGDEPVASYALDAVGAWGPLAVEAGQQYEFLISRPYSETQHHIYMQAFTRSNYWVRLLSVEPESAIATNIEGSERHTTVTAIRYKEFWGDDSGGSNDTLEINGTNAINAATSPIANRTNGVHVFDLGSDGVTDVSAPVEFFFNLPFQTGVDIYASAAPPEGAVCIANAPRGDTSHMQVINVPNLRSDEHRISVELTDFVREGDPECGAAAEPEPTAAPPVQLPDTGGGPEARADRGAVFSVVLGALALAFGALAAGAALRGRRS